MRPTTIFICLIMAACLSLAAGAAAEDTALPAGALVAGDPAAGDGEDEDGPGDVAGRRIFNDDFWETGTLGRYDEQGRLVYVVRTRLVPSQWATVNGRPALIDPYTISPQHYYTSSPRLVRSSPRTRVVTPGNATQPATGGRSVRPASSPRTSPDRAAPSARRKSSDGLHRSKR